MELPSLAALSEFEQREVVGVGDLAVSHNPNVILTTYSLGSCIGVSIYDPLSRVGGMLHVMLPDSSINPTRSTQQPAVFMDTGIPALFRAAYALGADKHRVQICVAGGAQVLDTTDVFNIGKRNYETLAAIFRQHGLKIQAEAVGGIVSRTMLLNLATGAVRLKVSGQLEEVILFKNS